MPADVVDTIIPATTEERVRGKLRGNGGTDPTTGPKPCC
jgi:hypothetical protein